MKIILCLALGLVVLIGGAWMWGAKTNASRQQTAADIRRAKNEKVIRDNYREKLDRAKAEGQSEIILPASSEIQMASSIEDIMRDYSLLRVKVKDIQTIASESSATITTWYKLEVLETIHQQARIGEDPLPENAPSDFLPLLTSESLMVRSGGTINVDGVRVVRAIGQSQFVLDQDQEYLIAVYMDCGGKLIRPVARAAGVFAISSDSTLIPKSSKQYQLVSEVESAYENRLDRLRLDARLRPKKDK
jgi:hypothetical protein